MKGLFIITILLLLGNLNSFSQSATASDTLVKLPRWIALRATQDLIRYDELKVLDSLRQEKIKELQSVITTKDIRLFEKDQTIARMNLMINNQDAIEKEIDLRLKQSEKEIRKQKTLKWLAIVGGVVSTGTAIYLLK